MTCSFSFEFEACFAVDSLPIVFAALQDVLVRVDAGAAVCALDVTKCEVRTGVGFDNSQVIAATGRAGVFHAL